MPVQESHLMSFWAEYNLYTSGRDPLGIRNSSYVIINKLLPGITSVTKRIRLYGFYPWILSHYFENNEVQSRDDQMLFIRRCEVLLSFIMASRIPREAGMDGNSYADSIIDKIDKATDPVLDIHTPARFYKSTDTSGIYYQAKGGVLDVVYIGTLINLGLIVRLPDNDNLLVPTAEGKSLSASFESNIDGAKELFFKFVGAGQIKYSQLLILLVGFDLLKDFRGTEEWKDYRALLIGSDFGSRNITATHFRRENIRNFLSLYQQSPFKSSPREYPSYYFDQRGFINNNPSAISQLWYAAALSEKIHYCQEVVFWCILAMLDQGNNRIPIKDFADGFAELAIISFREIMGNDPRDQSLGNWTALLTELDTREDAVKAGVRKKEISTTLGLALLEWFSMYHIHKSNFLTLNKLLMDLKLFEVRGNIYRDFSTFFQSMENLKIGDALKRLSLKLINQHIEVAFSKMNQGRNNVLRITIEDNCLIKLENDSPSTVANRIFQLETFLTDMKFIDSHGVTEDGITLLNDLNTNEEVAA